MQQYFYWVSKTTKQMQTSDWIRCVFSSATLSCVTLNGIIFFTQISLGQIVPDTSLGKESSVITPTVIKNLPSDRIDGGAIRGANLFHSFQEFNVGEGRGVYFSNPTGIQRIFTRVTGGNISQILGTLGVLGNADLFLINPNGIIFGSQARLDLNNSFIASTANSIRFANNLEFSATNPQATPLLTVNIPLGLQYGLNPGSIVNQSTAQSKEPSLQVPIGKTFALVGGDLWFPGGTMKASQGRIELGSVGDNSFVSLIPIAEGWALNYEGVTNFRDINLSQSAIVDTSGERGGDIQVQARRLSLTEGAVIYYANEGSLTGGNININASESIELIGGINPYFLDFLTSTQITNFTLGTGASGNLTIKTPKITITDGAFVGNVANGDGDAGNLLLQASELVELIGVVPEDPSFPSGVFTQSYSLNENVIRGNGGNLVIETKRLIVRDGALIGSNTFSAGKAGNLTIKASESVDLIGTNPDPRFAGGIGATVETGGTGNGGNLIIETKRLTVQGGGQIATSTRSEGNAGDLVINAAESIQLIGAAKDADLRLGSSGLFASVELGGTGKVGDVRISTERLIVRDGARISADNFGPNLGGNITINVGQLIVQNGGTVRAGTFSDGAGGTLQVNASNVEVSGIGTLGGQPINSGLLVGSTGKGNAGNLQINANSILLDNSGRLAAESSAGLGNIRVLARDSLIIRRNSHISTNSTGADMGGNINIITKNLVALENGDITANSSNNRGGQVRISATGLFGLNFQEKVTPNSDVTATGGTPELSGVVEINTPNINLGSVLVNLPKTIIDVEGLIARNICTPQMAGSSFTVTGRGGLPPNPTDLFTNEVVLVEWAKNPKIQGEENRERQRENFAAVPISPPQIIEAQGWIVTADGTVILTAETPRVTLYTPSMIYPDCNNSNIGVTQKNPVSTQNRGIR